MRNKRMSDTSPAADTSSSDIIDAPKMMDIFGQLDMRLQTAYEAGVSTPFKTLYLNGEVTDETARQVIAAQSVFQTMDGPVTVWINSPGGAASQGFSIYEMLRYGNKEVVTIGTGEVYSIAALILQAGTTRYLTKYSRYMIHNGTVWYGQPMEVDRMPGHVRSVNLDTKTYQEILAERSGLSMRRIKRLCEDETFLTAEQAVELGFADKVLDYELARKLASSLPGISEN